jgi:hypothetical protein
LSRSFKFQALPPQFGSDSQRINLSLLPPSPFITSSMIFAVMDGAQGHGEFIAHFERDPLRLGVANVMRLRGGSAANQTWLACHKA